MIKFRYDLGYSICYFINNVIQIGNQNEIQYFFVYICRLKKNQFYKGGIDLEVEFDINGLWKFGEILGFVVNWIWQ